MTGFVLTPAAEQDLADIWDYIAADNPEAAGRVLDAFADAFRSWLNLLALDTTAKTWPINATASSVSIPTW